MMTQNQLTIVEICGPDDPLLPPWLDLYETAFPAEERAMTSYVIRALQNQARGEQRGDHILAAVDAAGDLVGLAYLFEPPQINAAFLWYFAVTPQARCQGVGSWMYQYLVHHLRAGVKALIFDVEDPREVPTPEGQELARRRVGFYRRQGARILGGIRYIQKVAPHMPALHLHLMVQPVGEALAGPAEAFAAAKAVFPDAISQTDILHWE